MKDEREEWKPEPDDSLSMLGFVFAVIGLCVAGIAYLVATAIAGKL